jgi:hypothetical protein
MSERVTKNVKKRAKRRKAIWRAQVSGAESEAVTE